ncbi:hypothetical protein [Streptomyces sp. DHE17-7]|uniref:hypothetical protein n=1 Tax=Streptomyces sp. DHE17-7 TaxID=2759949 RepID=UPI0022EAF66F|nr:hypothetical protein [Streptomyces sp. DHE17-7]
MHSTMENLFDFGRRREAAASSELPSTAARFAEARELGARLVAGAGERAET